MFKKIAVTAMTLMLCAAFSGNVYASEDTEAASTEAASLAVSEEEGQVADKSEMAPVEELNDENLVKIEADDLVDGVYEIGEDDIESSSSMFRITNCELTVKDGEMTGALTLGAKGYLYLYMGTGEDAVAADEESYVGFEEDEDGDYVYTVSLEALGAKVDCAAFSKKKEKWYDRTLIFRPDHLPKEAFVEEEKYEEVQAAIPKKSTKKVITLQPETERKDQAAEEGTYEINVTLGGGSGKSTVSSPCQLTVKEDGSMTAVIEWSSPYYDYMIVDGEKYEPVNTEGNSVFEIPVAALDEELPVTADTTAMSEPHEVEYTLTFDSSSMEKK